MNLWCLFRHYYSAKREAVYPTRESFILYALATTREYFPGFWPEIRLVRGLM